VRSRIKATARCSPIDFSRDIPSAPLGVGLLQQEQQEVGGDSNGLLLARDSNFLYLWNGILCLCLCLRDCLFMKLLASRERTGFTFIVCLRYYRNPVCNEGNISCGYLLLLFVCD